MGRPKGSKNKNKKQNKNQNNVVNSTVKNIPTNEIKNPLPEFKKKSDTDFPFLTTTQYDKLKNCKKCGKKIISDPYRIDTNLIAGLCSQHRLHPQYVELCRDCAKELSDMVDNWLGVDYPSKWEDKNGGY